VGIIGKNGSGKSTLLKVLSRITEPTEGYAEIRGRVGSLLEVGTGFHYELTGRENIYLNGAILGMKKAEIARKFDEIVSFAEVEKFLDTPVKHYSSGMFVRLAFAVAAHLEPDILLVDEVLAVGDTQFQKKCLGKMEEVSRGGRTVLFVSHNMAAVEKLCSRAILLDKGQIIKEGNTADVIREYLFESEDEVVNWTIEKGSNSDAFFTNICLIDENGEDIKKITTASKVSVSMEFVIKTVHRNTQLSIGIFNESGEEIFSSNISDWGIKLPDSPGRYRAVVKLPGEMFMPKRYIIRNSIWSPDEGSSDNKDVINFEPMEVDSLYNSAPGGRCGMISMRCEWELKNQS